ncbi:MAG TPA: hypothetical protein VFT84_15825 [Gemmatimonadales bacterium]|nr:hypothetical protein [Gemmatimonadales bacterium]
MTFKPAIWQPIAVVLSAINLVAVGFAAGAAEPWHAGIHAGLGLAFGLWAQRMRQGTGASPAPPRVEELEADVGDLRRELTEIQERLDFAERMLAQGQEVRRVGPER